ncbi:MAG: hypothetical protein WA825_19060, partial [Steroidobacteraceae bacterium]
MRSHDEIQPGYDVFAIVDHRAEIAARYSPRTLAVKIGSENVTAWAIHAAIRAEVGGGVQSDVKSGPSLQQPHAASYPDEQKIVKAMLEYGQTAGEWLLEARVR